MTASAGTDPYVERHGLTYDQLWRRAHMEMALIERAGRGGDLADWRWDSIHELAERILDEAIAQRKALIAEYRSGAS